MFSGHERSLAFFHRRVATGYWYCGWIHIDLSLELVLVINLTSTEGITYLSRQRADLAFWLK